MKSLYDRYRLIKQILCRATAIPVIVSSFSNIVLLSPLHCILVSHFSSPFTGEILLVGVHIQECPILLLEGHYPSEFSSSLNQTHLNQPGLQDYLRQVFWDSLQDIGSKEAELNTPGLQFQLCVPKSSEIHALPMLKAVAKDYYATLLSCLLW